MAGRVTPAKDGFALRGIAPPALRGLPDDLKRVFWSFALDATLKRKDRELAAGLDKDGKRLKPISPETRRHRRSMMTPTGKGDPSAPPLTPGRALSRTRSLLTGKAFPDHLEIWWSYDPFTYDSWAVVLRDQRKKGRDVFGLSPAGVAEVAGRAWDEFRRWQEGHIATVPQAPSVPVAGPIKTIGSTRLEWAVTGIGAEPHGYGAETTGGLPWEKWLKHLRTPTGPGRNVVLDMIRGRPGMGGAPPAPAPPKPPKPKPRPKPAPKPSAPPAPPKAPTIAPPASVPAPRPSEAPAKKRFATHADVEAWARMAFPNVRELHVSNIPVDSWEVIVDELHKLLGDYPRDIRDRIERFGDKHRFWEDNPDEAAIALAGARHGNIMAFNPRKWQSIAERDAAGARAAATEWSARGDSARGTVRHEFAHLLDGHLWRQGDPRHARLYALFGVHPHDVANNGDLKAGAPPMDAVAARTVSQYATTNIMEAFAESFATMKNVPRAEWPEVVRKFAEIIES